MGISSKSAEGCSNGAAVLNVVMTCVGVGIVSLPSVFQKCGMVGGLLILFISYALSVYSANKLYYALTNSQNSPIHSFSELGRALFGRIGSLAATVTVQVTLFGVCGLLLTICGTTASRLFHGSDDWWRHYAAGTALVLCPMTLLRTVHEIRLFSAFGVLTLVGFIVTTLVQCMIKLSKDEQAKDEVSWQWIVKGKPLDYGGAFATSFLSFFMATSVPSLLKDMRSPKSLPKVLAVGSGIVLVMYAAICVTCYLTWGAKLKNVVDAMGEKFSDLHTAQRTPVSLLANSLMLGTAIAHYLPLMLPVSNQVDGWVDKVEKLKNMSPGARRLGTTMGLVGLTLLIGISTQKLDIMIELIGSITFVALAIYMPVLFYFRAKALNKDGVPTAETAFLYIFFAMGVIISCTTLYSVFKELTHKK